MTISQFQNFHLTRFYSFPFLLILIPSSPWAQWTYCLQVCAFELQSFGLPWTYCNRPLFLLNFLSCFLLSYVWFFDCVLNNIFEKWFVTSFWSLWCCNCPLGHTHTHTRTFPPRHFWALSVLKDIHPTSGVEIIHSWAVVSSSGTPSP